MNKTVLTKKIKGQEVVIGFDRVMIDSRASRRVAEEKLSSTEEYKNFQTEMNKIKTTQGVSKEKKQEILTLSKQMKSKLKSIAHQNIKYFTPKEGEYEVNDKEHDDLVYAYKNLKKDEVLLRDGRVVKNLIGKKYYLRDEQTKLPVIHTIENLDEDFPKKAYFELSEEDIINLMTDEQRLSAYNNGVDKLVLDSTIMREKLILGGSSQEDAQAQATTWYNEQVALLATKYQQ